MIYFLKPRKPTEGTRKVNDIDDLSAECLFILQLRGPCTKVIKFTETELKAHMHQISDDYLYSNGNRCFYEF